VVGVDNGNLASVFPDIGNFRSLPTSVLSDEKSLAAIAILNCPFTIALFPFLNVKKTAFPSARTNRHKNNRRRKCPWATAQPASQSVIASRFHRASGRPFFMRCRQNRRSRLPLKTQPLEYTNLAPDIVLDNLRQAIRDYGSMFVGNPVGVNSKSPSQLNWHNPKLVIYPNSRQRELPRTSNHNRGCMSQVVQHNVGRQIGVSSGCVLAAGATGGFWRHRIKNGLRRRGEIEAMTALTCGWRWPGAFSTAVFCAVRYSCRRERRLFDIPKKETTHIVTGNSRWQLQARAFFHQIKRGCVRRNCRYCGKDAGEVAVVHTEPRRQRGKILVYGRALESSGRCRCRPAVDGEGGARVP